MKRFSASTSQGIERSISFVAKYVIAAFLASASASVLSQPTQCGSIANAYGPYDYRTDRDALPIVDGAHFTPIVEALIRGNRGALGAERARHGQDDPGDRLTTSAARCAGRARPASRRPGN